MKDSSGNTVLRLSEEEATVVRILLQEALEHTWAGKLAKGMTDTRKVVERVLAELS